MIFMGWIKALTSDNEFGNQSVLLSASVPPTRLASADAPTKLRTKVA